VSGGLSLICIAGIIKSIKHIYIDGWEIIKIDEVGNGHWRSVVVQV
jgi:hypothetical protein